MPTMRDFIALAIDEAAKSIAEDAALHPLVGAVATFGTSLLGVAHRGEILGHHAEENLVEKLKQSGRTLVNATVYTTLEPCVQRGTHTPCAQLLVEGRPRKVVIGMLDPNPDICGKGVLVLQEAGIQVRYFNDHESGRVKELNAKFIRHFRGLRPGVTVSGAAPKRDEILQFLYRLTSADLAKLIVSIGSQARAQVTGCSPQIHQVNELMSWAESPTGIGLLELERRCNTGFFNVARTGGRVAIAADRNRNKANEASEASSEPQTRDKLALRALVEAQKRQIENRPLLRHLTAKESYAFLFPEAFVDPRIGLRKQPRGKKPCRLNRWLATNFGPGVTVAVIGPSGVGKTAALISIYLHAAEVFLSDSTETIPIFCDLRMLRGMGQPNAARILGEIARSVGEKRVSKFALSKPLLFFFDGLDEYLAICGETERQQVSGWPIWHEWHVLGSRPEAYFELLTDAKLESLYAEVIELKPWTMDQEVRSFAHSYLKKSGKGTVGDAQGFVTFLTESKLDLLATTPLGVMMLMLIWDFEDRPRRLPIANRSDLYSRFVKDWTEFECDREPDVTNKARVLTSALKEAAWVMYHFQRDYSQTDQSMSLAVLCAQVGKKLKIVPESLVEERAFISLLELRQGGRANAEVSVNSFRHESMQAYFVAEVLFDALLHNRPALGYALGTVYTYEVNTFVRERLRSIDKSARSTIETRLVAIYLDKLTPGVKRSIEIRNCASYYLGRLNSERLRDMYDRIRNGEITEHPMVTGTMASGLFLMNDEKRERDYLDRLKDDQPDDIRTRKYHLVYYGDLPGLGPESYLIDRPEFGKDDWRRTRAALTHRMGSSDERDLRLRTLDLTVFRRLCETRGYTTLTRQERDALSVASQGIEALPKYKREIINLELGLLAKRFSML